MLNSKGLLLLQLGVGRMNLFNSDRSLSEAGLKYQFDHTLIISEPHMTVERLNDEREPYAQHTKLLGENTG